MKKFNLGQTVVTCRVNAAMGKDPDFNLVVLKSLSLHQSGEWGDICQEDSEANDRALDPAQPDRILSAYKYDGRQFWIITEWDRSVTTVLFPEEY